MYIHAHISFRSQLFRAKAMGRGTSTRPWGWSSTVPVPKLQRTAHQCPMLFKYWVITAVKLRISGWNWIRPLESDDFSTRTRTSQNLRQFRRHGPWTLGAILWSPWRPGFPGSQLRKAAQADLHAAQFKPPSFIMGKKRQDSGRGSELLTQELVMYRWHVDDSGPLSPALASERDSGWLGII